MKPSRVAWLLLPGLLLLSAAGTPPVATDDSGVWDVKGKCLVCHKERTPDLFEDWLGSAHAARNVTCFDCHGARRGPFAVQGKRAVGRRRAAAL